MPSFIARKSRCLLFEALKKNKPWGRYWGVLKGSARVVSIRHDLRAARFNEDEFQSVLLGVHWEWPFLQYQARSMHSAQVKIAAFKSPGSTTPTQPWIYPARLT